MTKKITTIIFVLLSVFLFSNIVLAEIDTDGDGYSDEIEIKMGYSPYNKQPIRANSSDVDGDGLSDYFEYVFKTNPFVADSDNDGYNDFLEIDNAFDPNSEIKDKLPVRVEINLSEQTLSFFVAGIKWREFKVSTGKKSMPTPTGSFKIINKIEKAWSRAYGLWMPFWLGLERGGIGIHELPFWPSGYREGEDHLGQAVSHGCIRLGIGAAEYVYNHLQVGDVVKILP
ncbi:murein L,D-transpeptidase [Candidatus Falkowbacteria bacterium]|nr:murein L,D-transpeptidase [Candidatus Falkowbacteria bacterium]